MTRAEATARVVAAAKKVVALIDARPETDDLWSYGVTLRAACGDYDACPPEDTGYAMGIDVAAGMIATEADVQEARALAWETGERLWVHEASANTLAGLVVEWSDRALRAEAERNAAWGEVAEWKRRAASLSQPAPAPAPSAAPETRSTDARLDARLDALAAQVGRVESVVRQLTCWLGNTTNRQDVYERIIAQLTGGPDATA